MIAQYIKLYSRSVVKLLFAGGLLLAMLNISAKPPIAAAQTPANSGKPLQISDISIAPAPLVGQMATLSISVVAAQDEPDVIFTVDMLEYAGNQIYVTAGDTTWQGSLVANQPRAFTLSVVVATEGSWPIEVRAVAHHPDGSGWDDIETIHLQSTANTGELIRSAEPTPQIQLRQMGWVWHIGKVLFEQWWLSPYGPQREALRLALTLGSKGLGIPATV